MRRAARRMLADERGQSTVEYAAVVFALLSVVAGLGVLGDFLRSGTLAEHALMSASHHLQASAAGSVADVFMF